MLSIKKLFSPYWTLWVIFTATGISFAGFYATATTLTPIPLSDPGTWLVGLTIAGGLIPVALLASPIALLVMMGFSAYMKGFFVSTTEPAKVLSFILAGVLAALWVAIGWHLWAFGINVATGGQGLQAVYMSVWAYAAAVSAVVISALLAISFTVLIVAVGATVIMLTASDE